MNQLEFIKKIYGDEKIIKLILNGVDVLEGYIVGYDENLETITIYDFSDEKEYKLLYAHCLIIEIRKG